MAVADTATKVVTVVILSEVETWVVAVVVEEAAVEGDIKKIALRISLTLLAGKQNYNYFSIILSIRYFKTIYLKLRRSRNSGNAELFLHRIFKQVDASLNSTDVLVSFIDYIIMSIC